MATYRIRADIEGLYVELCSGSRKPRRLPVVGSTLPVDDPFAFRGTRSELIALTILTHFFHASDAAVLRGRTEAYRRHRQFLAERLAPDATSARRPFEITSQQIRAWHIQLQRVARSRNLFSTEENNECQ